MNRITNGAVPQDKSKDWQLEILMEKLRSKSAQYKSLSEISKNVRMTMLDKRYALDSVEKAQHQKCLDTLQHSIKVTSLQSMIERLESLTRQLGLKFMVGPSGVELFISSDMFYLEIVLDQSGAVKDVKVHHESKKEQQSCAELVQCLSRGDFNDFTQQLEGFASIYQLNAEKKTKCKAFTALQSLESDLSTLAQLQLFMKEPFNLLHKSPVGILEKRRGGHPMRLTYFVSPYDLLNLEKADIEPITVDLIIGKNLGYSVTVCIEGSATHKLQTTTLITVNRNVSGKNTPSFSSLSNQNSAAILACFVLKLNKPMPMCTSLVKQIQQLTELDDLLEQATKRPLLNLIVNHCSEGKMESGNNKGLFVTLPDQNHCYFLTENKNMDGILINSIPFTHPAHVSQILVILRQQALFNTVIGSCVRPNSRQDFDNMTMLEISALSWNHISISLEHPFEECMATAEIDLSDISNLQCKIRSPTILNQQTTTNNTDQSELCTKVLSRTFSIPITMRSIIKLWEKQTIKRSYFIGTNNNNTSNGNNNNNNNGNENFNLPLDSVDNNSKNQTGNNNSNLTEFGGLEKIKQETTNQQYDTYHAQNETILTNIELTQILSGHNLDRTLKKKLNKKKYFDDDLLLETSSNDSTSRSTQLSQETTTTNSSFLTNFHSDLELSGLDPTELLTNDCCVDIDDKTVEFNDLDDDLLLNNNNNNKKKDLLLDLNEKNLVPPSVSITPINFSQDKKSVIEIIPLTNPTTGQTITLSNSITITPINASTTLKKDDKRDKKLKKILSDDKKYKQKKRKRDDSPMGPPPLKLDKSLTIVKTSFVESPAKSNSPSPKNSPKHSPSGKPSMSTLKSINSPTNNNKINNSLDKNKLLKDKKLSVLNAKNKLMKLKSLDLSDLSEQILPTSPTNHSNDLVKSQIIRNRKGSLSAIVDKLKSAQDNLLIDSKLKPSTSNNLPKNSEYMVKPSLDGIKLTINKTKAKDTKLLSKSLNSLNNSKTGLKPGVNSGPASKKTAKLTSLSQSTSALLNFPPNLKKLSTSKLLTKSKTDLGRFKTKPKPNLDKSLFKDVKKASPTHEDLFTKYTPLMDVGIMKQLDKNYQIPKLSARNNEEKKKQETPKNNVTTVDTKIFQVINNDLKYPLTVMPKLFDTNLKNCQSPKETDKTDDLSQFQLNFPVANVNLSLDLSTKETVDVKEETENVTTPIVNKSPVVVTTESPIVNPSPVSPCITDDELMDEALIGLGK